MEARRRELLSQEDGYWRHRMAQEAAAAALAQDALARVPSPVRIVAVDAKRWARSCCLLQRKRGAGVDSAFEWRATC